MMHFKVRVGSRRFSEPGAGSWLPKIVSQLRLWEPRHGASSISAPPNKRAAAFEGAGSFGSRVPSQLRLPALFSQKMGAEPLFWLFWESTPCPCFNATWENVFTKWHVSKHFGSNRLSVLDKKHELKPIRNDKNIKIHGIQIKCNFSNRYSHDFWKANSLSPILSALHHYLIS